MSEDSKTFVSNKDGSISIKDGEKEVRYAKESDLLAVKGRAEAAESQLSEQKATWNSTEDSYKSQVTEHHDARLRAEVRSTELEEQLKQATAAQEELQRVKQDLEKQKIDLGSLSDRALGYRRQLLVATFNIAEDTVKDKTMAQLDSYEEALRALKASGGFGGYATTPGSAGAKPETPIDRAKRIVTEGFAKAGKQVE